MRTHWKQITLAALVVLLLGIPGAMAQEQPGVYVYGTWYIDGAEYECVCELVQPTPNPEPTPTPVPTPEPIPTPEPPPPAGLFYGYASYLKPSELPLMEIAQYTNFLYVPASAGTLTEADLQALRDSGIQALLHLPPGFDNQYLLQLRAQIDPYKDTIAAVCVVDEPYKPSVAMSYAELEAKVAQVDAIFPDYVMYVNFLSPVYVQQARGIEWPGIPPNVDLISTDILIHKGQQSDQQYLNRVGANLQILLDHADGRPVFYAADAYGMQNQPSNWPTVAEMWLDYQLYLDYGLDGLGWLFYEKEHVWQPQGAAWGSSHWPEIIQTQQEIGQLVLGGGPIPTPTPTPGQPIPTPTSTPVGPTPTPQPTPSPSDREEVLTVIINLLDATVDCPFEAIDAGMYGPTNSTASSYYESSRGEIDIFGETVYVDVPLTSSQVVCDHPGRVALCAAADEVLVQQGYDLTRYWRRAYVQPVCWGGHIDQQNGRVFSSECNKPKILAHEIGHTIGSHHARTEEDEYGDYSCVMGGAPAGPGQPYPLIPQWNAPHRVGLGWANHTTIEQGGQYTLVATELENHVILRVPKDSSQAYYISYRAAIGDDVDLEPEYLNRVSVHTFLSNPTGMGDKHSWLEATLGLYESWSEGGFKVTVLGLDEVTAIVEVTMQ